ncbi:hypothetical protein RugamoR64_51290 [Duganella rhizosphaerae]
MNAAQMVANEWSEAASGSIRWTSDGGDDRSSHGVIYYTALPYRKHFKQNKILIDASPTWSEKRKIKSIELFREIARKLGKPTRLKATVGYDHNRIKQLFVPFLLKLPIELADPVLQEELLQLQNGPLDSFSFDLMFDTEQNRAIHDFYERFFAELARSLDNQHRHCRQISLAALQKIAELDDDVGNLLYFILHEQGMIHDSNTWNRSPQQYDQVCKSTLRYITGEDGDIEQYPAPGDTHFSFEITSHNKYKSILAAETCVELHWEGLSSGMLSLIDQFTQIGSAAQTLADRKISNLLILIDEGDAFLHLDWQRRYIALLTDYLSSLRKKLSFKCVQVMLASHSPILASDVPACMVQNLDQPKLDAKTFGAELDDIIFMSFQSNSIGEHAANHIRRLHQKAKSGNLDPFDIKLIEEIGDQAIANSILAAYKKTQ